MKIQYALPFSMLLAICVVSPLFGQDLALPRSTSESQGVSSKNVIEFIEHADSQINSMHSFMLVTVKMDSSALCFQS